MSKSGRPPLDGIRVIDFSRVIAGPMCTQMLSDMGAEVIKIENPDGGDDTRKGAGPRAGGESGESHFFMTYNRGKKSVALDFTKPDGQAIVHKLLEKADVMVENFRPGVLKKYGLDYASIADEVPEADLPLDLGLRPDRAAVGPAGLRSGAAGRVGHDERQRRGQRRGAASRHRHRRHDDGDPFGGRDQRRALSRAATPARASTSISRSTTPRSSRSATWASYYLIGGEQPRRAGNGHFASAPNSSFETANGKIYMAVANQKLFIDTCQGARPSRMGDRSALRDDRRSASPTSPS